VALNDRHCEEQSDEAIHFYRCHGYGLLRFARNDGIDFSSQVQGDDDAKPGGGG
jgi:hypothetical protein